MCKKYEDHCGSPNTNLRDLRMNLSPSKHASSSSFSIFFYHYFSPTKMETILCHEKKLSVPLRLPQIDSWNGQGLITLH